VIPGLACHGGLLVRKCKGITITREKRSWLSSSWFINGAVQQLLNYTLCLFAWPLFPFLYSSLPVLSAIYILHSFSHPSACCLPLFPLLHRSIPWCFRRPPGSFADVRTAHVSQRFGSSLEWHTYNGWLADERTDWPIRHRGDCLLVADSA
jgi:hypothetical protein